MLLTDLLSVPKIAWPTSIDPGLWSGTSYWDRPSPVVFVFVNYSTQPIEHADSRITCFYINSHYLDLHSSAIECHAVVALYYSYCFLSAAIFNLCRALRPPILIVMKGGAPKMPESPEQFSNIFHESPEQFSNIFHSDVFDM